MEEDDSFLRLKYSIKRLWFWVILAVVGLNIVTIKVAYRQNLMARKIVQVCEKTNTPVKYHTMKMFGFEIMKIDSDEEKDNK